MTTADDFQKMIISSIENANEVENGASIVDLARHIYADLEVRGLLKTEHEQHTPPNVTNVTFVHSSTSREWISSDDVREAVDLLNKWPQVEFFKGRTVLQRAIETLIRAATQLKTEWQPIETAPKDGTKVLLYMPIRMTNDGKKKQLMPAYASVGMWKSVEPQDGMNSHRFSLAQKHGGYWTSHFRGEQPIKGSPSHWFPIPEHSQCTQVAEVE